VHRALGSLRRAGFAEQDGHGRYLLGDEFLRLAFAHHEARPDHVRVAPVLQRLANRFEETAHYAVLEDHGVVYRSKVDPPSGRVRLTSTIGGRNPAHCTAVGKLLLAAALPDDAAVRRWVAAAPPLERRTPATLVTAKQLVPALRAIREQGFAVDDEENEPGVNCVAVPAFLTAPDEPSGAVSVSALAYRTPLPDLLDALDEIRTIVAAGTTAA
jgi:DNA-binding IclR family transcriptional regulator